MKTLVVAVGSGQKVVTAGIDPALEGQRSGHRGAVVVDTWFVHSSSVERKAADHRTGLEHRAGTGTQIDARVVGCGAHAVVVVVEGQRGRLTISPVSLEGFVVLEEEGGGRG